MRNDYFMSHKILTLVYNVKRGIDEHHSSRHIQIQLAVFKPQFKNDIEVSLTKKSLKFSAS